MKIVFCSLLLLICFSLNAQTEWKLEKNSNGVKVYTRYIAGWGLKEFKSITEVACTLADAEAVLRDGKNKKEWMHNTYDTKDLSGSSQNEIYSYSIVDAPWPVSDRDNITKMIYTYPSKQQVLVKMSAAPTQIPELSGIVRVQKLIGEWRLTDLGNGKVEISQQCVADIGGNVPDWLSNTSVIDSPYNTLLNMKKRIESILLAKKIIKN